jgi:aryl-alcohol dehydrogenase-like predicted oxidoreductase
MNLTPADLGFDGGSDALWPEIALRFTLAQSGVHTAIIGNTNPDNARANLQFAEQGPLPANAVNRLREAFRAASAPAIKPWRGLT